VLHAVVVGLDPGCAIRVLRRHTTLEEVWRLDEVVVDRDERAPAGPALGLGEEADPAGPSLACGAGREEAGPRLELVEADARTGLGCHTTMIAPRPGSRPRCRREDGAMSERRGESIPWRSERGRSDPARCAESG